MPYSGAMFRFAPTAGRVAAVVARLGPIAYLIAWLFAMGVVLGALALAIVLNLAAAAVQAGPLGPFIALAASLTVLLVATHRWAVGEALSGFRTVRLGILVAGPVVLVSVALAWWLAPWMIGAAWTAAIGAGEPGVAGNGNHALGGAAGGIRTFVAGMAAWDVEAWLALVTLVMLLGGTLVGLVVRARAFVDRALGSPWGFVVQLSKVACFCAIAGGTAWFIVTQGLLDPGGFEAFL